LPKALAESKNQVLALSSFSVTLLRLNVYYLLIHGIKQFSNQHLLSTHHISTCYSMQYNGSSSLTDPDCRRAVTALVPTITRMGDHVSGRVRGKVRGQVQSGTRLTDLPYFLAYV
jgi:hypothetical protein